MVFLSGAALTSRPCSRPNGDDWNARRHLSVCGPHGRASSVQPMDDPDPDGPHTKLLSSALSQSIHWLPYLALASRCQLAIASAMAAPSPLISRIRVRGLYLVLPA